MVVSCQKLLTRLIIDHGHMVWSACGESTLVLGGREPGEDIFPGWKKDDCAGKDFRGFFSLRLLLVPFFSLFLGEPKCWRNWHNVSGDKLTIDYVGRGR